RLVSDAVSAGGRRPHRQGSRVHGGRGLAMGATVEVGELLQFAVRNGASDLHLSAGEAPMIRVRGDLTRVDMPPLTPADAHRMIFDVMTDAQRRTFQENLEADFAYSMNDAMRFRVNAFVQHRGEGAVFRHIPGDIPQWEKLGLPPILRHFSAV